MDGRSMPSIPACSPEDMRHGRYSKKRKLYESQREREFYSYLGSILSHLNTEPQLCNLHDPQAAASHRAVSSTDRTLTAFLQLVALRLETRRAMLFFFDADFAYILAESTRSMSLDDSSLHTADDALWLGFAKIPRGYSVCEITADLPSVDHGGNATDADTKQFAHIVNDLTEDTRFCDRAYVKDAHGPQARFYAGVPITSPRGINIGALCVLDDKPRDGLDAGGVNFLRELAATVMGHLELVRTKTDNQRSYEMNTALGAFIEGKSSSQEWWLRTAPHGTDTAGGAEGGAAEPPSSSRDVDEDRVPSAASTDDQPSQPTFRRTKDTMNADNASRRASSERSSFAASTSDDPRPAPNTQDSEIDEDNLGAHIKATVNRAATLLQQAMGADCIVFLDASAGTFGGYVTSDQSLSQTETETEQSVSSGRNEPRTARPHSAAVRTPSPTARHSAVLGSSFAPSIEPDLRQAVHNSKIEERTLRSLLRRYPKGQSWQFNLDGYASDEDAEDEDRDAECSPNSTGESAGSGTDTPARLSGPSRGRATKRARTKMRDGRVIQSMFPGARSLIFLGIWDAQRDRWFGAAFAISYLPMRMFSLRNEMSYLAAFCDVLLAEVARFEAQVSDSSKTNFISSISHELRSPLHGILGSAECLEAQDNSSLTQELLRSITSCGNTLLDVVNDLLFFSRINSGAQHRREKLQQFATRQGRHGSAATASDVPKASLDLATNTMLSISTEDAVDAACLGFEHQGMVPESNGTQTACRALVTLDIDDAYSSDWSFVISSGSWKRVVMNLVQNSLKYAPSGYISVSLRKKFADSQDPSQRSTMIVDDSGVGMSKAFQSQSLFRPFKQENSLVPGTGLGLNLVAQIVKAQGGVVHVRSLKNVGTCVRITMPLDCGSPVALSSPTVAVPRLRTEASMDSEDSTQSMEKSVPSVQSSLPNTALKVVLVGFERADGRPGMDELESQGGERLLKSLTRHCKRLGLAVVTHVDAVSSNDKHIYIVYERELWKNANEHGKPQWQSIICAGEGTSQGPCVVISNTQALALALRTSQQATWLRSDTQFISLPVGPRKMANAIGTCRALLRDEIDVAPAEAAYPSPAKADVADSHTESRSDANGQTNTRPALAENAPFFDTRAIHQTSTAAPSASLPIRQPVDHSDTGVLDEQQVHWAGSGHHHNTTEHAKRERRTSSGSSRSHLVPAAVTEAPIKGAASPPEFPKKTPRISLLLVDDNPINLRLLVVYAKKAGYEYMVAHNGREAVEAYKQSARQQPESSQDLALQASRASDSSEACIAKPDVILLDINMPIMDGFEAAREIRRFEKQSPGIKSATIIAVTGLGDTAAENRAMASGMDLFLTKPLRFKELGGILGKIERGLT
ncbi:hypothetical protein LTR62_005465 [Meristemomyces frigidus]|uniref:histidine kinase n=1 Tax=Meristemomyces frigidus TaxID=1508187 RepID=A0AAN7YQT5_9PEZI|nr:hypothetical protein LTR62_005465 [Meristemomyces frigidus]